MLSELCFNLPDGFGDVPGSWHFWGERPEWLIVIPFTPFFMIIKIIPETKGQSIVISLSLLLVEGKQTKVSITLGCIFENHSRLIEICCHKYSIVSLTETENSLTRTNAKNQLLILKRLQGKAATIENPLYVFKQFCNYFNLWNLNY